MKTLFGLQLAVVSIGTLLMWYFLGSRSAVSFGIGGFIVFINILVWGFLVKSLMQKKFVALSFIAIVLKYALLGLGLYYLIKQNQIDTLGLISGLGSLMITAVGMSHFLNAKKQ